MQVATETVRELKTVDKALLKKRFGSAVSTYDAHAKVQVQMAVRLVEMAKDVLPKYQQNSLEIGCGTGLLTREMMNEFAPDTYIGNDLVDGVSSTIEAIVNNKVSKYTFLAGDAEHLKFPKQMDSIWSGATIQWVLQLQVFFSKLSSILKPDGYLVISSFGPGNYREVKNITGNGIVYQSIEEIIEAAGDFELLKFEQWQEQLWFEKPMDILKHMRYTGVNGVTNCQWNKGKMQAFEVAYEKYAQLEGYPLTYHPYLMIFKKK
ncbi:malonyl-ACP O-methyltransferase BioC [Carboxylicivirga sp. A043]|uniref:malonyl-ACP O-methyltransferase BioC n=1 Tax=Carboxylicivirga litoralis TaxID=2816963 RepID=UPI0021CB0796|nr:malonyl-ACP O-methyltransferase BioC [Carboxylicivirga sp. A043]MCU4156141.1 malonyl-ACP O-methyltransferase BioC [Carboxylicivirga sp. A043]